MLIGTVLLLASIGLTAGLIGRVDSFENSAIVPSGQEWLLEWWAFPVISLAVLAGTFIAGMLFTTWAAAVATGHGIGVLVAIPYGFIALESNAPPIGAIIALPIAAFAWMGSNARFGHMQDHARF